MPLLFLTFLLVPLLEIYLLIEIGSLIGAAWTVAAVVGTAALGAALVRRQGLVALARFRAATEAGELPALTIMEGLVLLVAGALLLTPGFFTDLVGFICLTPRLRRMLIRRWLASRVIAPAGRPANGDRADVVEGEFRRIDD
ncbi:MAG TPA: exlusion protein FxsA [Gammaproteobacteria bacterium]|jgi:UPF0716 protein FxsA|nr:exlusion protein FxsA [Acidiferrobacteraceae bacterium]MDP6552157.1 FxsA family protein [Arenicellales bacterium]MDP6792211.1 FxsA family protein [Arenicellales bacterium]MDP6919995.1 FxsA family protein [Arenicellales bacterium]HCX88837.1 exlusion protein FxsA [Gammaproteobacteria bacterium]